MPKYNVVSLIVVLVMAVSMLHPNMVNARAGGGSSMGSRGGRSFSSPSYSAQPLQRTNASPSATPGQPLPTTPATGAGHPFLSGIGGGLLGAGLGSLLFGHSMGGEGGGVGILPILLMAGLGYFLYRKFKSRAGSTNFTSMTSPMMAATSAPAVSEKALNITNEDQAYFEQTLGQIQKYWSAGDITRLRQYVTPEMLQYFSDALSANSSRGLSNVIDKVHLEQGDIIESWTEYALDYATTQLRWSALDYMVRLDREPTDTDYIASGSKIDPVIAEEYWTFARAEGGQWVLSAIQQLK